MTPAPPPTPPLQTFDLQDVPLRWFGKYRPIAVLGHGGMATVYLATAQGPGNFTKLVVAKELRPELAGDPEFRSMFLDEARLAARLHNPNIVQTFEVLDEDLQLVIVMEYLDGQPLNRVRQRIAGTSPKATLALLRIVADALSGLHYAHELADYDGTPLRVVHRDVSPHNVFVTYSGETKVVDFGVAKVADASARTRSGVIKGKLSYMAPEQALGTPMDRRADVFAAGLIVWEIVAGRRAWKGIEDVILGRLNSGMIPRLRDACPEAPRELVRIVDRATAAQSERRYATAAEFQADLEEYLAAQADWPTTRQVGAMLTEAFAQERAQMRALIEHQMSQVRGSQPAKTSLPRIHERADLSEPAPIPGVSRTSVTTTESWNKSTSLSRKAVTAEAEVPAQRSRRALVVAIAIAGVAVVVALVASITALRRTSTASAPGTAAPADAAASLATPTASASPVASTASSTPLPRRVTLRVKVSPSKAKIYLDDKELKGNPVEITLDSSTGAHQLRATLQGYTPRTQEISLERDNSIEFSLDRAGAGGGAKSGPKPDNPEPDLGF